jgi:3-phosphoshikimate 1-carboxyvinyltransferase
LAAVEARSQTMSAKIPYVDIQPVQRPFRKTVVVPGSKSITNRALPMAALAHGVSTLTGVLFADDTRAMLGGLSALGVDLRIDEAAKTVQVTGRGTDFPHRAATLFCGNSGTTIRFLAALLSAGRGDYLLDGVARMRQRPIDELVAQLRRLGANIDYAAAPGFPPIKIAATGLAGGACTFENAKSSQYISAVLMAAPYAREAVTVELIGPVTSEPYVAMTLRMMEQWGYTSAVGRRQEPESTAGSSLHLPAGKYTAQMYAIEPDASNASYFLAAAAIVKDSSITVEGLGKGSLQGDIAFADVLHSMGAGLVFGRDFVTVTGTGELHGIEIDMNPIPDMVQTLAVVALFADSPTTITNVWNLRVKETDRLAALEQELRKLGAAVETGTDWIRISPPSPLSPFPSPLAPIDTYDDHRMAMAFAVAGLRAKGVRIMEPGCTAKTYPEYFADLQAAVA